MVDLTDWTLDEKVREVHGSLPHISGLWGMLVDYNAEPYPAGGSERHGVPELRFTDGPRGVACFGSTCFPAPIARGAAFDPELEERIGDAIGVEARTHGANFIAAVCINALRHPGWGRAQETYGEDPHHLGQLGAALTRGLQRHVMACAKHFACNSIEDNRFKVDVQLPERVLRETYLPHFRDCVDAGVASVMSAYNRVNGEWCGGNRHLLTEILRDEWGFDGFVVSDFVFGTHAPTDLAAGLDLEMPLRKWFGLFLKRAMRQGRVSEAELDTAVSRIVRTKRRFAEIGEPERYRPESVACAEHVALAREAATKSMVLLKNEPVGEAPILPLATDSLAVIGPLADAELTGDKGSSHVRSPYVVTPLAALRERVDVAFADGRDVAAAAQLAASKPAAVVVVGLTHRDEGESIPLRFGLGGDRTDLRLRPRDEALIQAVVAAQPRTVVVLVGGSAIITEAWRDAVPALVMAWYSGMEGGHALADLLFGDANFAGRLPMVWPRTHEQLPSFDPTAKTADYSELHGYRRLQAQGEEPAFPFGFGLSYTRFQCGEMVVDGLRVRVDVTNVGDRAGDEVVQLYVGARTDGLPRPPWDLRGFERVGLEAGESATVEFVIDPQRLAVWDGGWRVEPGRYEVGVGPSGEPGSWVRGKFELD